MRKKLRHKLRTGQANQRKADKHSNSAGWFISLARQSAT